MTSKCKWCDMIHGTLCPTVKAIEYFEDGITVKRVEFKTAADYPSLGVFPQRSEQTSVPIPTAYTSNWQSALGGFSSMGPSDAQGECGHALATRGSR